MTISHFISPILFPIVTLVLLSILYLLNFDAISAALLHAYPLLRYIGAILLIIPLGVYGYAVSDGIGKTWGHYPSVVAVGLGRKWLCVRNQRYFGGADCDAIRFLHPDSIGTLSLWIGRVLIPFFANLIFRHNPSSPQH